MPRESCWRITIPSGEVQPSADDYQVTKRMVEAGKLLDIPVIDHLIIGAYRGEIYSFKENNPEMFHGAWDMSVFPELDNAAEVSESNDVGARTSVMERLSEKKALATSPAKPGHRDPAEKQQASSHPTRKKPRRHEQVI